MYRIAITVLTFSVAAGLGLGAWKGFCGIFLSLAKFVQFCEVEAALIVSLYVDNIMMPADPFHSYCVALVVASQPTVEEWAAKQGIVYNDFAELCEKEETVKDMYASVVKAERMPLWISLRSPQRSNCFQACGLLNLVWLQQLSRLREAIRKAFADELTRVYA